MIKPSMAVTAAICCLLVSNVTTSSAQRPAATPYPTPKPVQAQKTRLPAPETASTRVVEEDCKTRNLRVGAFPLKQGLAAKYFDASFGTRRLMEDRWFYRSCTRSGDKIDCNTSCVDYEVYNERISETAKLKDHLPDFDNYLSAPDFKWPYVAYVAVSRGKQDGQAQYEFRVVNWGEKERMASVYLFRKQAPVPGQSSLIPNFKFEWRDNSIIARYKDAAGRNRARQLPLP